MDQADAELPERIEQGDHVFRPGSVEPARRGYDAPVGHLRQLRDRGLLDLPERSISQGQSGESSDTGAYLLVRPCYVTDSDRAALDTFRRASDRRYPSRRSSP